MRIPPFAGESDSRFAPKIRVPDSPFPAAPLPSPLRTPSAGFPFRRSTARRRGALGTMQPSRRGGRAVECGGLENRFGLLGPTRVQIPPPPLALRLARFTGETMFPPWALFFAAVGERLQCCAGGKLRLRDGRPGAVYHGHTPMSRPNAWAKPRPGSFCAFSARCRRLSARRWKVRTSRLRHSRSRSACFSSRT
jgi:hypothetical protein